MVGLLPPAILQDSASLPNFEPSVMVLEFRHPSTRGQSQEVVGATGYPRDVIQPCRCDAGPFRNSRRLLLGPSQRFVENGARVVEVDFNL